MKLKGDDLIMKTLFFAVALSALFLTGCVKIYGVNIIIENENMKERAEFIRQIDVMLDKVTKESGFDEKVLRKDKNGMAYSLYYKHYPEYCAEAPIAIAFFHEEMKIRLSSKPSSKKEIRELKERIVKELEKITNGKQIKIEEEKIPAPWFEA